MKQKIVIKARINCKKCKIKAIETVAHVSPGVISVTVKGEEVVVTGEEVDCATLACALKKKLGWAEIISVEQQNEQAESNKPVAVVPPYPPTVNTSLLYPIYCYNPYAPYPQVHVCECQNPSPCSIL